MRGPRDLLVWQKAMSLVTDIYRLTSDFPRHELYGRVSQLRCAAVSIPSKLAEGHARNSKKEFRQFVGQARGSLSEVETQIEIANNLGYWPFKRPMSCCQESPNWAECSRDYERGARLERVH